MWKIINILTAASVVGICLAHGATTLAFGIIVGIVGFYFTKPKSNS
jgi:hypothetical protein